MARYQTKAQQIDAWMHDGNVANLPQDQGINIVRSRPGGPCFVTVDTPFVREQRCDIGSFIVRDNDGKFHVYTPQQMAAYE